MSEKEKGQELLLERMKNQQLKTGCVSKTFLASLACDFRISLSEAYGVATFYSFLSTEAQGKHIIRVCKSVPCCMKDGGLVAEWIKEELKIDIGETTKDRRFTFQLVNCIGACDMAPAMLIDNQLFGHLNRNKIAEILRSFE